MFIEELRNSTVCLLSPKSKFLTRILMSIFIPIMFLYLHLVSLPVIFSRISSLCYDMCVIAVCVPLMDFYRNCVEFFFLHSFCYRGTSRLLTIWSMNLFFLLNVIVKKKNPFLCLFQCEQIIFSLFLNESRWYISIGTNQEFMRQ